MAKHQTSSSKHQKNTKHQAPNTRKTPNTKLQTPKKLWSSRIVARVVAVRRGNEAEMFPAPKIRLLTSAATTFEHTLTSLGNWRFGLIWRLVFGVWGLGFRVQKRILDRPRSAPTPSTFFFCFPGFELIESAP